MKKILPVATALLILFHYGCGPREVQWHQQNAKYRGLLYPGPGLVWLRCCEPGTNCADRDITTIYTNPQIRTYVQNDNLAGYFLNEDWQSAIPELIDYPSVVDSIIHGNPKAMFTDDIGFVIFKDRNLPITDTSNILFAFVNRAENPCDKQ